MITSSTHPQRRIGCLPGARLSAMPVLAGYASLLVLGLLLPFDLTQHPLAHIGPEAVTNVSLILGAVIILTAADACTWLWSSAHHGGVRHSVAAFGPPLPLGLLLLLWCVLSSLFAATPTNSLRWTLEMGAGSTLWLAAASWLASDHERRVRLLSAVFVLGAVLACIAASSNSGSAPAIRRP